MKRFVSAILETLVATGNPPTGNEPPDSLVGESEFERKNRNFWWIAGWVLAGLGFAFYLIYQW